MEDTAQQRSGIGRPRGRARGAARPRLAGCEGVVARERAPGYETGHVREHRAGGTAPQPDPAPDAADEGASMPDVHAALAMVRKGLASLAAADPGECSDRELGDALLATTQVQALVAAQEARLVRAFDNRAAARADACTSTAGWLRLRTNLGPGAIKRRVKRAKLLERMPALAAALGAGDIGVEHVDAVLQRAVPRRVAAIAEHDHTLATLARSAEPRHVAVAVQRIVDQVDADGTDDPPVCANDALRDLRLLHGFSGMGELRGTTTPLLRELLLRIRQVYDQPDPADTAEDQRRTSGQRFHDALQAALQAAIDNRPGAATGGVKTHVVVFADLLTLAGRDELATIRSR